MVQKMKFLRDILWMIPTVISKIVFAFRKHSTIMVIKMMFKELGFNISLIQLSKSWRWILISDTFKLKQRFSGAIGLNKMRIPKVILSKSALKF